VIQPVDFFLREVIHRITTTPESWLAMQNALDVWQVRQSPGHADIEPMAG